jgi:uncharacterized protein YigA (DUF484 family)
VLAKRSARWPGSCVGPGAGPRLLLLGSGDAARFTADAGTQYLERIADLLQVLLDADA